MVRKGRRFSCGICHREVWVCRRCDRRRKYCSPACRHEARKKSIRRARKRFLAKEAGRLGNARRQREWYRRKKQPFQKTENLTHQYSPGPSVSAILPAKKSENASPCITKDAVSLPTIVDLPALPGLPRCHFCGCPCCEDPALLDFGGS